MFQAPAIAPTPVVKSTPKVGSGVSNRTAPSSTSACADVADQADPVMNAPYAHHGSGCHHFKSLARRVKLDGGSFSRDPSASSITVELEPPVCTVCPSSSGAPTVAAESPMRTSPVTLTNRPLIGVRHIKRRGTRSTWPGVMRSGLRSPLMRATSRQAAGETQILCERSYKVSVRTTVKSTASSSARVGEPMAAATSKTVARRRTRQGDLAVFVLGYSGRSLSCLGPERPA